MKKILCSTLSLLCFSFLILAQKPNNQQSHTYQIFKTSESILVDGELNESIWAKADTLSNFWYSFPVDDKTVEPEYQTEVMMTYDDKFIYVAAICHGPGPYIIPSLKRNNRDFWDGDVFSILFDPNNEKTNGFAFTTNPSGVQHDMLVGANTGTRGNSRGQGFNSAWDNKWLSESREWGDRWTTELAIPFNTLKYGNKTTWGINITRLVSKNNSVHTWAPTPIQLMTLDLGYTGSLLWDQQPPKAKSNISVIPYMLGSTYKDTGEGTKAENNFQVGGDAKIAISSNLNLDLTVNPDFSQVDVDEQVTNLTTVNVRFPERRLFFLENSDIFSEFGIPPMRPFFSRRFGLDESGQPIPILYGARLSGNVYKDLRIGLMNLQTKASDDGPGQNYTSFAFNQRVFGRTLFKGYFLNRQAYEDGEFSDKNYNRALGGEFEYRSINGALRANAGYGLSLSDGVRSDNEAYHFIISYDSRKFSFYYNIMGLGNDYIPDMGFMSWLFHYDSSTDEEYRIGYVHQFSRASYTIYPEKGRINSHQFGIRGVLDFTKDSGDTFIGNLIGSYNISFANTSSLEFTTTRRYSELFFPFGFTDGDPLLADEYDWFSYSIDYESDNRKKLFFRAGVEVGDFYNGKRQQYSLTLNYRQQPWGNFGLTFVRNRLEFPEPFGSTNLTLIGPKIEVNFSKNLFWTTFLQYNTQADNFNINSRLQWQFQPLSNLFVVYTDNYAIDVFGPKNRALVVKLNYWLNL